MRPIERAARALVAELDRQENGAEFEPDLVEFKDGLRIRYIDQYDVDVGALVRAVLLAVREPTPKMLDFAFMQAPAGCDDSDIANIWNAMLDAALSE